MNHRIGSFLFALATGLGLAWLAWQWGTTPVDRAQRELEESMVLAARAAVRDFLGDSGGLEIVDPLNPNRVAGKVFIYPVEEGFQVSGYYRRRDASPWYPWLVTLDDAGQLMSASAAGPEGRIEAPLPP